MILFFLALSSFIPAHARWAKVEDANWQINYENVQLKVEADGKIGTIVEREIEILKEGARNQKSIQTFDYNSRAQSFEILEAKTINPSGILKVGQRYIEDKPKASSPLGFDQYNQVMIAFPQVDIGSKLYLKYKIQDLEIPFESYNFRSFAFGWEQLTKKRNIKIVSAKKLFYAVNDPRHEIEASESREGDQFVLNLNQKRSLYFEVVEETKSIFPVREIPWVDISTHNQFKEILDPFIAKYEEILSAPLPQLHQEIRAEAANTKGFYAQVNTITSQLQSRTHYLGDWRPIKGGFIPRSLSTISETRFGDCKDFAASTVAILRSLGYKADVAFVYRGNLFISRPTTLPSLTHDENHAIVHVEVNGESHWIDPTNSVSFAEGIFPDIADRPSFILNAKNPHTAKIPIIPAQARKIKYFDQMSFKDKDTVHEESKLSLEGTAAIATTGYELAHSKEQSDYMILEYFAEPDRVKDFKFAPYELKNRMVKNVSFEGSLDLEAAIYKTSSGFGLRLSQSAAVNELLVKVKNRVSDLFLNWNRIFEQNLVIKDTHLLGKRSLNCQVDSPWLKARRLVHQDKKDIHVEDQLIVKQNLIPIETLQSPEYLAFQKKLRYCFDDVALIISNRLFPPSQ